MKTKTMNNPVDITQAFEQYNELIYKYIFLRVGGTRDVAEDLVQDIFLKVWRHRDSYDSNKASLKTWIFRIARNTLTDHYRTSSRRQVEELDENLTDRTDIYSQVETQNLAEFILKKMKYLKQSDQEVLTLRYVTDLSIKEIAHIVDKEYSATKVAIHRALGKLKELSNEAV